MIKSDTVLYVDDEPINLRIFALNFRKKYAIITAESGFEGLKVLKSTPEVKVVISDMRMPGMNGIEFIKLAKKEFPDIVFYILTGFEITEEIADALNEKLIHKYFRKPFNVKDIDEAFEKVLC
jgi:two-component system, response regulator, stage 0 sporulation protein F